MGFWRNLGRRLYNFDRRLSGNAYKAVNFLESVPPFSGLQAAKNDYMNESRHVRATHTDFRKNYAGRIIGAGSPISLALSLINPVWSFVGLVATTITAGASQYFHHLDEHASHDPTALELAVYRNCIEKKRDPANSLKRWKGDDLFRRKLDFIAERRGWNKPIQNSVE